jgi:environmental stress-induced protein Ves
MELTRLSAADYRRTPWKNGGGVTVDIADEYAPGAEPGGWAGIIWRFGRTRIERPSPFSDLSGNDRILAVVAGRGLVLRPAGRPPLKVREPFRPVRFPGEWAIESELEDGPVEVVNLIGDRAKVAIDLIFVAGRESVPVGPGVWVFYAPSNRVELAIADERLALAPGDAVVLRGAGSSDRVLLNGVAAIATIQGCERISVD